MQVNGVSLREIAQQKHYVNENTSGAECSSAIKSRISGSKLSTSTGVRKESFIPV